MGARSEAITVHDDFCKDSDPYGEHDFGSVKVDGHTILFKVDYFVERYDSRVARPIGSYRYKRILTIMLAEEY
ncbi:DUF3768 domain-containing protein [Bradyrhizobium sp. 160]|nr:DUF3768 domain-containing protein [Bradyrhizobium sp. 179]MCK1624627.1 DUF3768 domain-containing protein [Bradyrhizobium sp. 160]